MGQAEDAEDQVREMEGVEAAKDLVWLSEEEEVAVEDWACRKPY